MYFTKAVIFVSIATSSAFGAPAMQARNSGGTTDYTPGLGADEQTNTGSEAAAALSGLVMTAISDRCPGCTGANLGG
ncbi:hypothetical protein F4780DRAFT_776766 [Xylariomycetidae sp. FL0641]|nr:hypothetical protein F4780DRAFT_776766 [Xylariomycetidae sp. FL0641]